jgi:hypothetical protein
LMPPSVCVRMGRHAPVMGYGGSTSNAVARDPTTPAAHEAKQQKVDESKSKHDYTVVHVTKPPTRPASGRAARGAAGGAADAAAQARVYSAGSWAEGRTAGRCTAPAHGAATQGAASVRPLEGGGFCASTSGGTIGLLAQRAAAGREKASAVGGKSTAARVHERAAARAAVAASGRRSYEPALG